MSEQSGNRVGSTPFAAITVMSGSGLTWQPTNSASMERKGEDDTGQAPLKHTWFLHGNMRGSARWNRTPLGALAKPWHCLPLQPARGGGGAIFIGCKRASIFNPSRKVPHLPSDRLGYISIHLPGSQGGQSATMALHKLCIWSGREGCIAFCTAEIGTAFRLDVWIRMRNSEKCMELMGGGGGERLVPCKISLSLF